MEFYVKKRAVPSRSMFFAAPLLAVMLSVASGAIMFAVLGDPPLAALQTFFIDPLGARWSLEALAVKATPLILIALGLSIGFYANVWNIGAEGQLTIGAILGSLLPILLPEFQSIWLLPIMMILGALGGMMWAALPALLKTRFGVNEILPSLLLVYVAQLLLDWLVRGPLRDPDGYNFPESRLFSESARLPVFEGGNLHYGILFVVIAVICVSYLLYRTRIGFGLELMGSAPRAGHFAGFSSSRTVWLVLLISGGMAGLAGIVEIAGSQHQLMPQISPGYGFTAIIVAFLGRLNPFAIAIAGFLLALTYLGGEGMQISLGTSEKVSRVFQGMLLFYVLMCNALIYYQIGWRTPWSRRAAEGGK